MPLNTLTAPVALLLVGTGMQVSAANLDFNLDPGLLQTEQPAPNQQPAPPGVDVALTHPLLHVKLDYDFRVNLRPNRFATQRDTQQFVGASLNSAKLDKLLGANARVKTDSRFVPHNGGYSHLVNPILTRRLQDFATLSANYQLQMQRTAKNAAEHVRRGFSIGLQGELAEDRLHWRGSYSSAQEYRDVWSAPFQQDRIHIESDYRLLPTVSLQLTGAYNSRKHAAENNAGGVEVETIYGAGLSWSPLTAPYSVDVTVQHSNNPVAGQPQQLHNASVSWFPTQDISLSLGYGSQLVQGTSGVLLQTRLYASPF